MLAFKGAKKHDLGGLLTVLQIMRPDQYKLYCIGYMWHVAASCLNNNSVKNIGLSPADDDELMCLNFR